MSQFTLNQRVKVNPTELLWLAYVSESQLNSSLCSAFCHQHQLLSSSSIFFIVIDDNKRTLLNVRRGQGSHLLSQRAVEKSNISQRSALALLQKPFTLVIGNSLVSTRSKVRLDKILFFYQNMRPSSLASSLSCNFDCQPLFWRGGGFKFKLTEQSLRSAHNPIN